MKKKVTYRLKVPSNERLISIINLWKFILIIHLLSDTFSIQDILNIKKYPINNRTTIGRLLSYLKYLGIVTEKRKKVIVNGKKSNKQHFHLTVLAKELKRVALYEPDNLKKQWKHCLQKSELYLVLTENEEFHNWHRISTANLRRLLEESFTKNVENKKERIDKAEKYIIDLLEKFDLFKLDGNYLIEKETEILSSKGSDKKNLLFINESSFEMNIKEWNPFTLRFLDIYNEYKKSNNKTKNLEDRK